MAEVAVDQSLEQFEQQPDIANIIQLTRENLGASLSIGEQHVTQGFSTAEELAEAFKGQLAKASPDMVEEKVKESLRKYKETIKEYGTSEEAVRRIFEEVWIYSRLTNPKCALLEEVIATMEETEGSAVFASGLAAINAVVRQFTNHARKGEHGEYIDGSKVVVVGSIYGGTNASLKDLCEREGLVLEFMTIEEFKEKGLPKDTNLVYFETSENPTLEITPITEIVEQAKGIGAITACDNTFTPITVKPHKLGVDVVIHSATKYINGKSEDLGGVVAGNKELVNKLKLDLHKGQRMIGGANMAPIVAEKFLHNMQDLPQRLFLATQNMRSVQKIASEYDIKSRTTESDTEYKNVRDPNVTENVSNGMIALYFNSQAEGRDFINRMIRKGIGEGAVSLGAVKTYYSIPADTTHSELPAAEQEKNGITPGLVRMSCGIEWGLAAAVKETLEEMKKTKETNSTQSTQPLEFQIAKRPGSSLKLVTTEENPTENITDATLEKLVTAISQLCGLEKEQITAALQQYNPAFTDKNTYAIGSGKDGKVAIRIIKK